MYYNNIMIKRHLEAKLLEAIKKYPIISLTGPRQSGKTFLVKNTFKDFDYVLLENSEQREFAQKDPCGFLRQFKKNVILDEVQRAPELFSHLQGVVDERNHPGQFVLTGSQNFLLLEGISQSLAGRVAIFKLLPFSLAELREKEPPRSPLPPSPENCQYPAGPPQDPFELMFKGFYPRIHDQNLEPQEWLRNYYQTYIERDVRLLTNVGDLETFGRFMRLCAGRSGQILDLTSLANDGGISHTTAKRWLSLLEASYLVFLLRPFYRNYHKRVIKRPKLYFIDTGLLCYLLRIKNTETLISHASRGAVFETFVISEFFKKHHHLGQEPDLYFWKDSAGNEIDLIMDEGEEKIAVEIKSGETMSSDFFKSLFLWKKLEGASHRTFVIYAGKESFRFHNHGLLSWNCL